MDAKNNIEKAYELIEQFEFAELSDTNRLYVLSVMTEDEYSKLRSTISGVKTLLEVDIEPGSNILRLQRKSGSARLLQLVHYPVKLYQVAAGVAILTALYLFIEKPIHNTNIPLIARTDTVYMHKTDTVYARVFDTIKIFESKVHSIKADLKQNENKGFIAQSNQIIDCNSYICPGEVGEITTMNTKNTISGDSALKEWLVSLN